MLAEFSLTSKVKVIKTSPPIMQGLVTRALKLFVPVIHNLDFSCKGQKVETLTIDFDISVKRKQYSDSEFNWPAADLWRPRLQRQESTE